MPNTTPLPFDIDKKRIIKIILSIFETGKQAVDYSVITVLPDGAGITYGAHQSTDGGEDSLDKIATLYVERGGALAAELEPYLARLAADETKGANPGGSADEVRANNQDNGFAWVADLMEVLQHAGSDAVMALAQEEVFEREYWEPAAEQAAAMGLVTPLAWLVCYDSTIHSGKKGIGRIRSKFPESPPANGGDEHGWVVAYLQARRNYLLSIPHAAGTVYRIDSMLAIVTDGNWNLDVPVKIQKPRSTIS